MKSRFGRMIPILFMIAQFARGQQPIPPNEPVPIFRVTVVEGTTKAININTVPVPR